jgi:2-polyprenyl-6-methoxyphenol hydroxylase-like FAD-dependent oxidoreductase
MNAEAIGFIEKEGVVVGVRATTPVGNLEVAADLVVAADGRHSRLREAAGLAIEQLGAPMDVLWFGLSRRPEDPPAAMGRFGNGRVFVMLNRGDYWQCGFVIRKGSLEQVRARGLEAFRDAVAKSAPFVAARTIELRDWNQIKLLSVAVDRMPRWFRPGVLFIGDAAHAMSPIGGVGINLAIQDAVAAANILTGPLLSGTIAPDDLREVQERRELPTRITQRLQVFVQNRVVTRALDETQPFSPPLFIRLMARIPALRRIPARLIGIGIRPEHVALRPVSSRALATPG